MASKVKACQEVGFKSTEMRYSADITEEQLLAVVDKLNQDADVDGYIAVSYTHLLESQGIRRNEVVAFAALCRRKYFGISDR